MEYIKAIDKDIEAVCDLVHETIKTIYPKYYPTEVVDFFCGHHCKENIEKDIKDGRVGILVVDKTIVGTGCYDENHITRVYVKPEYQGQGYGSFIMQCLETDIARNHDSVVLDASLPASTLYEKRGYRAIKHEKWKVENGVVLVYEIMEKLLASAVTEICYDGRFFVPKKNTENGEVDGRTLFEYHQKGTILWADYSGGDVLRGHIIGNVAMNGELDFYYQHINVQNQLKVGKCHSIPRFLDNGKLELAEKWQWLNGDMSEGESTIIERD